MAGLIQQRGLVCHTEKDLRNLDTGLAVDPLGNLVISLMMQILELAQTRHSLTRLLPDAWISKV